MIFRRLAFIMRFIIHFIHVFWQLLYGVCKISKLKRPMVTIFGGSRFKKDAFYFTQAYQLASLFIENEISVLTGGGPGIMEAANCGAGDKKSEVVKSIGIGVEGLTEKPNVCSQEYFVLHYFFARKWLLTRFSRAFIVFPGGFGTLDELFEIMTLIQTEKMDQLPIVLFGISYWKPMIDWLKEGPLKEGLLHFDHLNFFILTDDVQEAFSVCKKACGIL